MCGRFALTHLPPSYLHRFKKAQENFAPHYNIAPGQMVWCLRWNNEAMQPELVKMRWGFIPFWAKPNEITTRFINARIETVAEKPMFRHAFHHYRCIIFTDGFYEWRHDDGKQPYFIRPPKQEVLGLAGLWNNWHYEERNIDSCTIIVKAANEQLKSIHERMPVILNNNNYCDWLNPDTKTEKLFTILNDSLPFEKLIVYPVSAMVNNPRNDIATCIQPLK